MKKLIILMAFGTCFAGPFDSVSSVGTGLQCSQSCDPGAIMKVLQVSSEQAKSLSTTACQVSCSDQCFAGEINNKVSSEIAATKCKDSLKKTFKLN